MADMRDLARDAGHRETTSDRELLDRFIVECDQTAFACRATAGGRRGSDGSGQVRYVAAQWDVPSGRWVRAVEGHTWPVDLLAFSPDGEHLFTRPLGRRAILWNTALP